MSCHIKSDQQYTLCGEKFFKVVDVDKNIGYRDLYVDLSKNSKTGLMQLASFLKIKNKDKMKKDELLNAVRQLITFEW